MSPSRPELSPTVAIGPTDPTVVDQPVRRRLGRGGRLRQIASAGFGTLVGSALGALLPFLLTRWFSLGRTTDAYFLVWSAVQLAAYVSQAVVESTLLPLCTRALKEGEAALTAFARTMRRYAFGLGIGLGVLVIGLVCLVLLPTSTFTAGQRTECYRLLAGFALFPLCTAVSSVFSAAHYSRGRFAQTALTQAFRAVGGITFAAWLGPRYGITIVAVGVTLGEAVRLAVLAGTMPARRLVRTGVVPRPLPDVTGRTLFAVASPVMLSLAIVTANPLIDKAVATRLQVGSTTVIELAEKLFYIPAVLCSRAVALVSVTVWGRLVGTDDAALRRDYWRVQRLAVVGTTVLVAAFGLTIVAFKATVVRMLHLSPGTPFESVFLLYLVGLPFALSQSLAGMLVVTYRRTSFEPPLAAALVVINLVADLLGARLAGVAGIAASSTIVRLVNASVFIAMTVVILRDQPARPEPTAPLPAAPRSGQ
jgi:peptidoglycan biosynthesis protein MviN/MurJ (putative lipid II flippase)